MEKTKRTRAPRKHALTVVPKTGRKRAILLLTSDETFEHPLVKAIGLLAKPRTKRSMGFVEAGVARRSLAARGHGGSFGTDVPRTAKLHYQSVSLAAGVTAQFGSIEFQLDQFEGYADWKAVADAYRLLKVRVKLIPQVNTNNLAVKAVTTTAAIPLLYMVKDYDDATAPSSVSEVMQYNELHSGSPFKAFEIELRPRVSAAVYAGGVTNGYAQEDSDIWLDIANDDIEHYGLKWAITSTGASQTTFPQWYVVVDGWFEFRQWR